MLNNISLAVKTGPHAAGYWKAALLLLAVFLLSVACTVEVTPDHDNGSTAPSEKNAQSVEPGTPESPPADKPEPGGTPDTNQDTVEDPITETPGPQSSQRTVQSAEPLTVLRIPSSPTPEPDELLPKNTLALVMAVSGSNSSSTLKTIINDSTSGAMLGTEFITLESSSKSVVIYLPDTGETTVIDSYYSLSYAPHFKRPYTIDNRLYVSNKYTDGGQTADHHRVRHSRSFQRLGVGHSD